MADNVEFKFTIVGENAGGGGAQDFIQPPAQEAQNLGKPNVSNPTQPNSTAKMAIAASLGVDAAKQIASSVSSNIGKWTGSSSRQRQIDTASKLVGYGVRIAVDPTPFKIASIASIAIETGFEAANYHFDLYWENKNIQDRLARTGLNSIRNN